MRHEVTFRPYTQDLGILFEVLEHNRYNVPDDIDGTPIIDIGAHIGAFALACLHKGALRVVCYEPDEDNFDLLEHNTQPWAHHVTLHREAVTEKTGVAELTRMPVERTAGHHTLLESGLVINATGIKDLLLRYPKVKLLKMSVNGMEKPILDTPCDWNGVRAIVGEMYLQASTRSGARQTDQWLQKKLYDLGFRDCGIVHDRRRPTEKAIFFGSRK